MRVAIVRQQPVAYDLIAGILEARGHEVRVLPSLGAFAEADRELDFDLIVLAMEAAGSSREAGELGLGTERPVLWVPTFLAERRLAKVLSLEPNVCIGSGLCTSLTTVSDERRRSGTLTSQEAAVERLAPYAFDMRRGRVFVDGVDAELTQREFELAAFLFRKTDRVWPRRVILEAVWGVLEDVSTRTLDTHISRLRRKLSLDGRHGWLLRSVYQRGYRLESPAHELVSQGV